MIPPDRNLLLTAAEIPEREHRQQCDERERTRAQGQQPEDARQYNRRLLPRRDARLEVGEQERHEKIEKLTAVSRVVEHKAERLHAVARVSRHADVFEQRDRHADRHHDDHRASDLRRNADYAAAVAFDVLDPQKRQNDLERGDDIDDNRKAVVQQTGEVVGHQSDDRQQEHGDVHKRIQLVPPSENQTDQRDADDADREQLIQIAGRAEARNDRALQRKQPDETRESQNHGRIC